MLKYTLNRFMWAIITLWATITLTFVIMHSIPGDPFAREGVLTPAVYENLMRYYNMEGTKLEQYFHYLKSVLQFDLGPSLKSKTITVNEYIEKGLPVSFHLGLQSMVIAVCFGLILGVIAALYRNRWPDYISMIIAIIGISVPSFILATLFINYLAVEWRIFPVATWKTWKHTVLPSMALAMMPLAYIARLMRTSMIEVMNQDYILTAKSKGLKKSAIIIKHAIRNAILPVVTMLGILTANLVTGSFIVESIFGIPGMGEMFVKSILNRDYPVILGSTIVYSAILIFLIFIVDVLYTLIDPRIKLSGGRGK
ncbi:ABC transporter permease [Bacillus sp. AGMB 02131]|uniref:ABC transporter permease n=1 Tax=Peribacillus faecalis TaxID=2772559 RepID=A0A927HAY0_9BACI|nr:ABC transporter permease [Peribacillus faecalis]MBD3107901.1 ABC transporter permease [Peribacillus faecalis]